MVIKLEHVNKTYSGGVKAADNLSLTVRPGEIFGFLGPNGAGKTTAIKKITGILAPDSGRTEVTGIDISQNPLEAKKQIGFVPDTPNMFLRLKGIEYLNFMGDIYEVPLDIRRARIADLCERFEMTEALNAQIQSYSHGMRQKIIIIGVLLHDPEVWILDEPMTGLDPRSSFLLKEMMREHVSNNKILFFSTHVLDVAEKICDRIAIINRGKILFTGNMTEMREHFRKNDSLEKFFLELTDNEE